MGVARRAEHRIAILEHGSLLLWCQIALNDGTNPLDSRIWKPELFRASAKCFGGKRSVEDMDESECSRVVQENVYYLLTPVLQTFLTIAIALPPMDTEEDI